MEINQILRCNSCFSGQEKNKNCPFLLTSCGHIFCKKCLTPGEKKCRYCKVTNISSMTLTDSLSPEVKYIFQPLEDSFEKLRSAFVFQETQAKITYQRLVDLEKKYAFMSSEYLRILRENNLLRADLKLAQETIEKYKSCLIEQSFRGAVAETSSSTLAISTGAPRHVSFVTPSNLDVQIQTENGIVAQTPVNQRLHRLSKAPNIIKKQKGKKRAGKPMKTLSDRYS